MLKKNGGLLTMIFSTLGIVLFVNFFEYVMTAFDALWAVVGIDDLLLFGLILNYGPTVLLLGILGGMRFAYYKGFKITTASDSNGLIRMVMGGLGLVMFVTLFEQIATVFVALYTLYTGDPNYPIFDLAVSIAPTILFLGGLVAFIGTGVSGVRARSRRRAMATA